MAHTPAGSIPCYNQQQHHDPRQQVINHQRLVENNLPPPAKSETNWVTVTGESKNAAATPVGEGDERIHSAASQGCMSSVLELLTDGQVSCDIQDRFGKTALHWAAEQGHLDIVRALKTAGAWIDPCSRRHDATPLMLAALRGHEDVVLFLLNAGAGLTNRYNNTEWRSTALHYAAKGGHVGVVITLLDAGFHKTQQNEAGWTPAEISVLAGHASSPTVTRCLLGAGSDRGGELVYRYVNMAVADVSTVYGLVQGGAYLNWQDKERGHTPLHRAAFFRHFAILRVLLWGGANPDIFDNLGNVPLHMAATSGCMATMAILLEAGANTTARTHDRYTPLHLAVVFNKVDVVGMLLRASRSSMELIDMYHGITPLSWAARMPLTPVLRVLLSAGANVDSRSPAGLTPLHWACCFNCAENVELLLEAGADPSATDNTGADAGNVIGLGDTLDPPTAKRAPLIGQVVRHQLGLFDVLVSSERIRSALKRARQDRAWRRRGWLVVLAKRRAVAMLSGVASKRLVASERTSPAADRLQLGKDGGRDARQTRLGHKNDDDDNEKEAASEINAKPCRNFSGENQHHGHLTEAAIISNNSVYGQTGVEDGIEQAVQPRYSSGLLAPLSGCVPECQVQNAEEPSRGPGPNTIEALIQLSIVEAGLFRNVLSYM